RAETAVRVGTTDADAVAIHAHARRAGEHEVLAPAERRARVVVIRRDLNAAGEQASCRIEELRARAAWREIALRRADPDGRGPDDEETIAVRGDGGVRAHVRN